MTKRKFTVAQLEALEAAFQQDAYLNEQTKLSLAEIGLNNVQIKNWFQNTRFKRRKSGVDPRLDFDLILGKPASEDKPTPAPTEKEYKTEPKEEEDKPKSATKEDEDKSTPTPTEKEDKLTSDPNEDEDKRTPEKENMPTPAPTEEDKPTSAPKDDEDKSTSTLAAVKAEIPSVVKQEV